MDKKVYEKTRYQNIFRHIKNRNYVIRISEPVQTSISKIDGKKIYDIKEALNIRDNPKIKKQKGIEAIHKEDFDSLWEKYINNCIYVKKLTYNSLKRKDRTYSRYLKNKITIIVSKTNKDYWSTFIANQNCSLKQKNQILKELKSFFNWCLDEEILISNPVRKIKKYFVPKVEMKFWVPEELTKFLDTLKIDLESNDLNVKKKAYMIKILTLINFSLGDRIGETRALQFNNVNKLTNTISINSSINYDTRSNNFLSSTKTYQSQRIVDVTEKLITEIDEYKKFLIEECKYPVHDDTLIFFNYATQKPYSDTTLRKAFHYYCDKAKVNKIRLYDLRHTYVATMMGEGKEEYLFSKRIGHKKISTTIDKYGHLSTLVKKEFAKETDKYY